MSFDTIIIGAGHNGMTAAAVLAKSGRKVLVLEAGETVGGMAQTAEFASGFRASSVAHVLNRLDPAVIRALDLYRHGLATKADTAPTIAISQGQDPLILNGAYGEQTLGLDAANSARWQVLRQRLMFQSSLLKSFVNQVPIQPGAARFTQKWPAIKTALRLKLAGKDEMRQFMRMILMAVADVADEDITDDRLLGLLAFDATLGVHLGPRSPTSMLGLYYRLAGQAAGARGGQVIPVGGMGAVMQAFQSAAKAAGVVFRTGAKVTKITVENGRATGVVLTGGEAIAAREVVSAIHPATTFLDLVGPRELDAGLVRDIRTIRTKGNVSRINLALNVQPEFSGVAAHHMNARFVVAPSTDHVERAFNPSKYDEMSGAPCFEFTLPTAPDSAMAPDGGATLSIAVSNTPYGLKGGWKRGEKQLERSILSQLEKLSPGIGKSVVGTEILTPPGIEARYNVPGGHWHHGEFQVDRLYSLRPVFGIAHYKAPIDGLFITGAGTHPGGGVSGSAGLNAARVVMEADK